MRTMLGALCLPTLLLVSVCAAPVSADQKVAKKRAVHASRYDASMEVTIVGSVERLDTKPAPGKMLGGHLLVSTAKGTVDAVIGGYVLRGSHPFSPVPNQKVKIVGVMTTIHGNQIFLARTIETENGTVTVRNSRGFLVSPGAKGRIAQASIQGGSR